MAYTQFKGFKRVLSTNTAYSGASHGDFMYFVRDNANDVEGQIWFQGMCYGSCRDSEIDKILEALEGFIPASGEVINIKEYIDEAIAQLESDVTTVKLGDGSFSGLTLSEDSSTSGKLDYTLTLTNVAPKDEFDQEKIDRAEADEAIEDKLEATAQTLSDAIEAEEQAREAADDDLQDQIDELSGATDDLQAEVDRIETAVGLNADGTYVADDGQYVSAATSVKEATGMLNDALVQEVVDRNQAIEDAIEALIGDASESGNTLGELEDRIEELSADAKEYHLVKIENDLPATVKERYELQDASGNTCGTTIDIAKDSHIVSIRYISDSGDTHYQNLEYTYLDVCGATKTEYVDMSQLVLESEFASGVTSANGVVRGVVDAQSEDFLTVGADGFKLSGVQDAINSAVSAETEAREDADDAIESALTLTAQTLVEMIENAASAATTEVVEGTDAGNNLSIVESAGADSHKIYTINLTDVASATALTAEINARKAVDGQNGDTYAANANANYISDATSLNDADVKLDAALKELADKTITENGSVENYVTLTVSTSSTGTEIAINDSLLLSAITAMDLAEVHESGAAIVSVSEADGKVSAATGNVDTDHVVLASALTGTSVSQAAGTDESTVLQQIVDAIDNLGGDALTAVTSTGNTLSVGTPSGNEQNIEFLKETATDTTVAGGHLELAQNANHEWYGVMYWIDEEK